MERIVADPKILGGKPIIKGTRIAVSLVLDLLASGMTPKDIIKEYSHLTQQDIQAATRFAAALLEREHIVFKKAG